MYEDEDLEENESPKLRTLKRRNNFLTLSKKGNRIITKGMVVEYAKISDLEVANDRAKKCLSIVASKNVESKKSEEEDLSENKFPEQSRLKIRTAGDLIKTESKKYSAEIGFTASKKIGSAVYRNRAKRIMKEAARDILRNNPKLFDRNYRFNIIARHSLMYREYVSIVRDLKYALHNIK